MNQTMLKKSIQKQYLVQHWENLETQFDQFCEMQDAEALHQFRVAAKKIHSLLKLQCVQEEGKVCLKDYQEVRAIFKHAGRIREAQLHLATIESLDIHEPHIRTALQETVGYQTAKFELKRRWYSQTVEAALTKIKDGLVSLDEELAESFLHQHLRTIGKNCQRVYFLGTLHDTRKSIKTIQHLREMFPEFQVNWEYLDNLQGKIGTWHDLHRTYLYIYNKGASVKSCTLIRNAQQDSVKEIKGVIRKFEAEIKQHVAIEQD
jgi:CHAD domain-containing protein